MCAKQNKDGCDKKFLIVVNVILLEIDIPKGSVNLPFAYNIADAVASTHTITSSNTP